MDVQIAWIQAFQAQVPGLESLFSAIAFLGMPAFYLLFIPFVLWCLDRSLGLRLLIFLSVSGALCDALKILFHSPRPYWVSTDVKAYSTMGSFGFPSAHAQNAVVFFGTIAAAVRRWWAWILCILLVLAIGLARVYQAVHFPADILAGWGIGLALLCALLLLEKPILDRVSSTSRPVLVLLAFCCSLALVALTGTALFLVSSWQMPASWPALALAQSGLPIDPFLPQDTLLSAGILFGALAGAIYCPVLLASASKGTWTHRAGQYILGICILAAIVGAFTWAAALPGISGYAAGYTRAALAGFWITCGAPVIFARIDRACMKTPA